MGTSSMVVSDESLLADKERERERECERGVEVCEDMLVAEMADRP